MDCCKKRKPKEPLEHGVREEQESGALIESAAPNAGKTDKRSKLKKLEDSLLQTIKRGKFEEIEREIKPKKLKYCESNSLLMGMKVNFELRRLADSKGPDEKRFSLLANSVEEFTTCLLEPLRSDERGREEFGDCLDEILEDAIQLEQKKFFTHPVVDAEMKRKWHGRELIKTDWKRWQLLFSIWCLFDLVFSPILLAVFSYLENRRKRRKILEKKRKKNKGSNMELEEVTFCGGKKKKPKKKKARKHLSEIYLMTLETPYFKFVRDTLSYIVLLVLHYALCLSPSTISFSGLEWAILVFFIGRFLVEQKQLSDAIHHLKQQRNNGDARAQSKCISLKALPMYLRDLWNKLDFLCLIIYSIILVVRLVSFIMSGSVENNRTLIIASYFYGFNTMCLTLRVFGHVMEQSKDVGTIQIALFSILKEIIVIIWQFTAAILAFSIAITKVYVAEKSFYAKESGGNGTVCKNSGISCWWAIMTHMGWSLLGISDGLDPMTSVDAPSETIAQIFYAGFFIMGIILLVNMLIALLSNTYQRIQDNSLQEWSFKTAVTIQTYDGYDPIPVPLNIIYSMARLLRLVKREGKEEGNMLGFVITDLDRIYTEENGNSFPVPDEQKHDLVLRETLGNRQMISQILDATFEFQFRGDQEALTSGPKMWQIHTGVMVEGHHLTCEDMSFCAECQRRVGKQHWSGARYRKSFSREFPHFEVAILETGKQIMLAIGVVNEGYNTSKMPGVDKGTVGYYTEGVIYDAENNIYGKGTEGPAVASRGDRIRCTVMFENAQERNGRVQVPIFFTLNGTRMIILRDNQTFMDFDPDTPLYPYIAMTEGCSVLAKLCSAENEERGMSKTDDLDSRVTKIEKSLEETNRKLDILLARLTPKEQSAQGH